MTVVRSRLRLAAIGGLVAAFTIGATACSSASKGSGAQATAATADATGTVQMIGSEPASVYQPMIDAFHAKNPAINVKYTSVPFDQYTSVLQQRLSSKDRSVDVYAVDQPTVASFAARGYLQDISQLAEQVKRAVLPGQYDVNVFKGKLWAAPISTSTQFMFYNTSLLAKAGVTAPTADPQARWTWEDTLTAAKKAQAAGATWGLIPEQIELYYQLQPLAESLGGGSGLSGKDNLTPDVTNAAWIKAFSFYQHLFADKVAPRGVGSFQTSPLFTAGKLAFFIGGPWDVGNFASAKGLNWGMAAMPYFAGGKPVTPNGGWSLGINPASANKAAALKFLEYASIDPDGDLLFAKNETNIPANAAAFHQYLPRFTALGGAHSTPAGAILEYEANNTAVNRPVSVGYTQFETIINKAFGDIRNGSDAASRLGQASGELTRVLAQDK